MERINFGLSFSVQPACRYIGLIVFRSVIRQSAVGIQRRKFKGRGMKIEHNNSAA